jgi:hypothetical protein
MKFQIIQINLKTYETLVLKLLIEFLYMILTIFIELFIAY